jgi:hypothetical protein
VSPFPSDIIIIIIITTTTTTTTGHIRTRPP